MEKFVKGDYFDYIKLPIFFEEDEITKNVQKLFDSASKIVKDYDESKNTLWILRHYLAVKMILASTVLLTSSEYSRRKNIRISEPYMLYYSLLNCSRAVVFTNPNIPISVDLFTMTHKKTINMIGDILSHYNRQTSDKIKSYIELARIYREIFSYRYPANGMKDFPTLELDKVIDVCSLLCEVAQIQSAVIEHKISKINTGSFKLHIEDMNHAFMYGEGNLQVFDDEDFNRIKYIERKVHYPLSIYNTMTEGLVEDFFGAWCSSEEEQEIEDCYNPDKNWRIIFPVP